LATYWLPMSRSHLFGEGDQLCRCGRQRLMTPRKCEEIIDDDTW
jgi:hypothetical protein